MSEQDRSKSAVELIDEQTVFTLADLCRTFSVEAEFIEALVEEGTISAKDLDLFVYVETAEEAWKVIAEAIGL